MKKIHKYLLLFVTLILLLGLTTASATESNNNNNTQTNTLTAQDAQTTQTESAKINSKNIETDTDTNVNTQVIKEDTTQNTNTNDGNRKSTKQSIKKQTLKNNKEAQPETTVYNFNQLKDAINAGTNIIRMEKNDDSNYNVTGYFNIALSNKDITIYGNGLTLDGHGDTVGVGKYGFIVLDEKTKITFKDLTFENFYSIQGLIYFGNEYNTVNFTNCTFKNNKARDSILHVAMNNKMNVINSTFINNTNDGNSYGSVISTSSDAPHNAINVNGSKFFNNTHPDPESPFGHGPIYSSKTINVTNSEFDGNNPSNFKITQNEQTSPYSIKLDKDDNYIKNIGNYKVYVDDELKYDGSNLEACTFSDYKLVKIIATGTNQNLYYNNTYFLRAPSITVTNFEELKQAILNAQPNKKTVIIMEKTDTSDYNVTEYQPGDPIQNKEIIIYGNGLTLDGQGDIVGGLDKYGFLELNSNSEITFHDLTFKNFYSQQGLIYFWKGDGYSTANFTNCTFKNNKAQSAVLTLPGNHRLNVNNSTFINNTNLGTSYGSAITSLGSVTDNAIVVNGSKFINNTSPYGVWGPVFSSKKINVTNSEFDGNDPTNFIVKQEETNKCYIRHALFFDYTKEITEYEAYMDNEATPQYTGFPIENWEFSDDYETIKLVTTGQDKNLYDNNVYILRAPNEKVYTVKNYEELAQAIDKAKTVNQEIIIINLIPGGNYNATTNIIWGKTLNDGTPITDAQPKTVIINGTGILLDGNNKFQFIEIEKNYNLTIGNITIRNYTATEGGAFYVNDESILNVTNVTFIANSAQNGGAIYKNGSVYIFNSSFINNTAQDVGGDICSYGWANALNITNTNFTNNTPDRFKFINDGDDVVIKLTSNNDPGNHDYRILEPSIDIYEDGTYKGRYELDENNIISGYTVPLEKKDIKLVVSSPYPDFKNNQYLFEANVKQYNVEIGKINETVQNVKLNVTVKGEDNKPLKDVTVNITLPDGTNITGKTDANGNVTFTPDLSLGPHMLKVAVIGQEPYKNYYTTVTVEVKPINTNMTVSADNVIIGENTTISGILYDVDNKPIKNKIITIRIDKNYINEEVVVDSEGKYELSYETGSVGEHTIKVIFSSDNENYTGSINTTKFTVSPRTTNMTITNNATIKAGQNVTITGVLTDIFKEKVTNTYVNIKVGSETINNVRVNGDGEYTASIKLDEVKSYNIIVEYKNDTTKYTSSTNTSSVTVKPLDTNSTITATNIIIGQNTTITGTLHDENNKKITNTAITIKIDENYIQNNIPVDNQGNYKFTYNATGIGEHTIKVIFTSNNKNYTSSTNTTTFTVSPRTTNMTITNNATIKAGQNVTITGVLTDIFKEKITNTKVNITIEGYAKIENVEVDGNGRYLTTQTIDKIGTYKITVEYKNDTTKYTSSTNTSSVTVDPRKTMITFDTNSPIKVGTKLTINGEITDELGQKVTNTKVTIKIGNNTINNVKVNDEGQFTLSTTINNAGKTSITVTYANNTTKYTGSSKTSTASIEARKTTVTVTTQKAVPVKSNITITGTLTDELGQKVTNTKVTVKVNSKTYNNIVVDKNGKYSMTHTATTIGNNNVTVTYKNTTTYYTSSSNKTTFQVTKLNTAIKLDTPKAIQANDTSTITGTLRDSNKNTIANANIQVTLNNKTINVKTDKNGKFTAKFTENTAGTNNITATYKGNSIYNPSTASTTQKVSKKTSKITVDNKEGTIGEKITLTAHITDEKGNIINGGNLVFKLNGKTLRIDGSFQSNKDPLKIQVINGIAKTTIIADIYMRNAKNLTATYSGNSIYTHSNSKISQLEIQKRNATIKVTTNIKKVKQNRDIIFQAKVTDNTKNHKNKTSINQEGYVFFKLNGKTIKDYFNNTLLIPVKNGKANYTYHVPTGTGGIDNNKKVRNYTVTAVYTNENFYPDIKGNATYNVIRSPVTISFNNITVANNKLKIRGWIGDYEGNHLIGNNKVCVKINGRSYEENGKYKYFTVVNGKINISGINVKNTKISSITLVTGERQAYLGGRATITNIQQ